MATTDRVAEIMAELADTYPKAEIRPGTLKAYCKMLADIPPGELEAAVAKVVQSSRFFPTIAEIREAWALAKTGPKRSGLDAWADVIAEVRRVGYQGTPRFDDPAIPIAVRSLGGWQQLCGSETGMADRSHFAKAYESIAARNLEAVQLGKAGMRPELPPARPSAVRELPEPSAEPVDIASAVRGVLADLETP